MSATARAAGRAAAMVAAAALVVGACSTNREVTSPEPVEVTPERLTEALLTVDDLPEGVTSVDGDGTPLEAELLPEHVCDDSLADLQPEETVSADFVASGALLTSTVAWFPGSGSNAEQVVRDLVDECEAVVSPEDELAIRARALDYGVLSDDTLALQVEVEPVGGPIEERDLILLRDGDFVSVIRLVGPRPSDKVLLDTAVRPALRKLSRLHDDAT